MKIAFVEIQNFRKLKSCRVDFSEKETIFVGANNSGKTSAMDALIVFLKEKGKIITTDITLSNWFAINDIGVAWIKSYMENTVPDITLDQWEPFLPSLDIWLKAEESEIHYVSHLIPTLDWQGGLLGVRLRYEPKTKDLKTEDLHKDFIASHSSAETTKKAKEGSTLNLWPCSMRDFLDKRLKTHFTFHAYILDPTKIVDPKDGVAQPQQLISGSIVLDRDPFDGLIKIDIINAQRGFSDPNTSDREDGPTMSGNLSSQLRHYFTKHLNPSDMPGPEDIEALEAIEAAQTSFDLKLKKSFESPLSELQTLGYPGFSNPRITLTSKINPIESLNHPSALQFDVLKDDSSNSSPFLCLPEKYNGLGYQNLVSMVFNLIRFRDEWMRVGKVGKKSAESSENEAIEPLHLVLVEEPEAHLHAQVQQVFIRKAHEVLRNHVHLKMKKQFTTQLVVSTHSSHIAHEINFTSLRYFRRKSSTSKKEAPTATVINLSDTFGKEDETTKFAVRYLKTTHCDLFFADAAVLVEGPAERMLVPHFVHHHFPQLSTNYISLLEIGGSHAHRLRPLIETLGIITLIITDLDSVERRGSHDCKVLPEKTKGYKSGNTTIRTWLPGKELLDDVLSVTFEDKECKEYPIRVAYQYPINIEYNKKPCEAIPYTFEDALSFQNISLFRTLTGAALIGKFKDALENDTIREASESMFNALENGKKAEFALELLFIAEPKMLEVPRYITEGLLWLQGKLETKSMDLSVAKEAAKAGV